jgi:hypothetical protein
MAAPAPRPYSGTGALRFRIEHAGPKRFVEWRPEYRIRGASPPSGLSWSKQAFTPPGTDATLAIRDSAPTTFQLEGTFEFGSTTLGEVRGLVHLPAKSLLLRGAVTAPVVVADSDEVVVGAILADLPAELSGADVALEKAVEGAAWAVVFKVRLR